MPENFPLLLRAYKLQKKASKKGFDWKETDCVIQKILEELNEVKEAEKITQLLRAYKLQKKTYKKGFDWKETE